MNLKLAVRDISSMQEVFPDFLEYFYPTPAVEYTKVNDETAQFNYVGFLKTFGFANPDSLFLHVKCWVNYLELLQPSHVICDLSPTCQFAAAMLGIPYSVVGTGYECPRYSRDRFYSMTWQKNETKCESYEEIESSITSTALRMGTKYFGTTEFMESPKNVFLTTYPELDVYGERENTNYYGCWSQGGDPWPNMTSKSKKIFAYLKYVTGVEHIIGSLHAFHTEAVIFISGCPKEFVEHFSSNTIRIVNRPIDMSEVVKEASLAITNGNHGTTGFLVSRGVPVLAIPLQGEQYANSQCIVDGGFGLRVQRNQLYEVPRTLKRLMLEYDCFKSKLTDFSHKCKSIHSDSVERIVNRIVQT